MGNHGLLLRPPVQRDSASRIALSEAELAMRVGSYQARDASWSAPQLLFVNRGFDFGLAMALPEGPGIAAGRRRDGNSRLVNALKELPPMHFPSLIHEFRARCSSSLPRDARIVRVYGLLFGEHAARLRFSVEVTTPDGGPRVYSAIGDARPADEFRKPGELAREYTHAMERLALLLNHEHALDFQSAARGRCSAGDDAAITGQVSCTKRGMVISPDDSLPTLVACAERCAASAPP